AAGAAGRAACPARSSATLWTDRGLAGMPPRRRVDPAAGAQALAAWVEAQGAELPRQTTATAVRYTPAELAAGAPGRSGELRGPPYGAVSRCAGPRHTRGTTTTVVETYARAWVARARGALGWEAAEPSGAVRSSGIRADLSAHLPLD